MNETLEKVRHFADNCHGTQMRKYSTDRYIVHPIRVMKICTAYTDDQPTLAAALLHDVLEDTPITTEELKEFLMTVLQEAEVSKTIDLVVELTDVYVKDSYPQWNRRVRKQKEAARLSSISAEAQTIKYADIIDNAPEVTEQDPDFAKSFIPEYRSLLKKMDAGNAQLYARANATVNLCMRQLQP